MSYEERYKELSQSLAHIGRYKTVSLPKRKKTSPSLLPDFLKKKQETAKRVIEKEFRIPERKRVFETLPVAPEKEVLYETPETIASKLNSLSNGLGQHVIKDFPTIEELAKATVEAIKNLQGNDRIDISHIRNGEQLSRIAQKVDMNDMRWHGSGGASTTLHFALNEVVAGSGTTFTLAHTPTTGTVAVYALGQRLVLTTDYTISGAVITTVSSWLAGQIVADYQY